MPEDTPHPAGNRLDERTRDEPPYGNSFARPGKLINPENPAIVGTGGRAGWTLAKATSDPMWALWTITVALFALLMSAALVYGILS